MLPKRYESTEVDRRTSRIAYHFPDVFVVVLEPVCVEFLSLTFFTVTFDERMTQTLGKGQPLTVKSYNK